MRKTEVAAIALLSVSALASIATILTWYENHYDPTTGGLRFGKVLD